MKLFPALSLAVLLISLPAVGAVAGTNILLSSWFNVQTNLQTWSADFIQTRTFKSLTQPLVATGQVWFAEPNRFRWELGRPPQTIAVRAPNDLLIFYPRLKRVERFPLTGPAQGQWRDALALLEAGFPRSENDLRSRFQILSQATSNAVCSLILQPKSAPARRLMPQIRIEFTTNTLELCATELRFADGSTMRNDFQNGKLNPPLSTNLFNPPIDPGYTVVKPVKEK
jgi:outer membrane lipoprotein-sorting protein